MPGLGTKEGTAFRQDLLINRPVAEPSLEGFFFFALDDNSGTLYQCNGTTWVSITGGLRGLVAGPGITLVNTPTTITINNTYSLPIATSSILGGIKVGSGLAIDLGGVLSVPEATTSVPGLVEIDRNPAAPHSISVTKYGLHRLVDSSLSTDSVMFFGDDDTDYETVAYINIAVSTVASPHFGAAIKYTATGQDVFLVGNAGRVHITPVPGSAGGFESALNVTDITYIPTVQVHNNRPPTGEGAGCAIAAFNISDGQPTVIIQALNGPGLDVQSSTGGRNVVFIQQRAINTDFWEGPNAEAVTQIDRTGAGPFTGPMLLVTDEGARVDYGSSSTGPLLDLQSWQSTDSGLVDRFSIDQLGSITKYHASTPSNGQLLIGDGSKFVPATLTAGSNITITNGAGSITITATGGGGGEGTGGQPYVRVTNSLDQRFEGHAGIITEQLAFFDTTVIDQNTSMPQHDNTTNNTRLVCRQSGRYLVGAHATANFDSGLVEPHDAAGLFVAKNSPTTFPFDKCTPIVWFNTSGDLTQMSCNFVYEVDLIAGDFIELKLWFLENSGDVDHFTLQASSGSKSVDFWMFRLAEGGGIGAGSVQHNGSLIGTRPKTNFIDGSNVTLTVADNPGSDRVDVTIASTGGGGGGGGGSGTDVDGKILIQAPNVSTNVKDDEFNDSSGMSGPMNGLDSKWSKHNLGTSSWLVFDDTIAPGCLAFTIPSGQTLDQAIYQTVPAGDFTIQAVFDPASAAHREMWYIFVVNTSGNGFGFGWDKADTYSIRQITTWQQSGTRFDTDLNPGSEAPQQLWFKKVGTNYTGAVSFSTRHRKIPNRHTVTTAGLFTPAYIGFGRVYDDGGSGTTTMLLDAFRVT